MTVCFATVQSPQVARRVGSLWCQTSDAIGSKRTCRQAGKRMPCRNSSGRQVALAGPKGFTPKAKIDMDGVQKVLELRSVYGEPKKALTDPTKYYDSKYYDAAMR
jgi:hypothetical protein